MGAVETFWRQGQGANGKRGKCGHDVMWWEKMAWCVGWGDDREAGVVEEGGRQREVESSGVES